MTLSQLEQVVEKQIANGNVAKALLVAHAGIAAFKKSEHASDAKKAQEIADALFLVLLPLLPEVDPLILAIIKVLEPYIGRAIDWVELHVAGDIPGVDEQDGPPQPLPPRS